MPRVTQPPRPIPWPRPARSAAAIGRAPPLQTSIVTLIPVMPLMHPCGKQAEINVKEDSGCVEDLGPGGLSLTSQGWWRWAGWRRAGYDGFAKKRVCLPGAARSAGWGAWAPHPDRWGQGPTHPSPGARRRRHAAVLTGLVGRLAAVQTPPPAEEPAPPGSAGPPASAQAPSGSR